MKQALKSTPPEHIYPLPDSRFRLIRPAKSVISMRVFGMVERLGEPGRRVASLNDYSSI
jgi:hypothetical protein